jgi:hypothetical protein
MGFAHALQQAIKKQASGPRGSLACFFQFSDRSAQAAVAAIPSRRPAC